jgi:hypothetical protein
MKFVFPIAIAAMLVLTGCGSRCGFTSPGYPLCGI